MSPPPNDLNSGPRPDVFPEEIKQDNYVLNEIKQLLLGDGNRRGTVITQGEQPDGTYVGDTADGALFETQDPLGANETFESEWYDTQGFRTIEIFVNSNEPSLIDGFEIEYTSTPNATTPDVEGTKRFTYTDADADRGYRVFFVDAELEGFRFRYTNNSTATDSDFAIFGTLRSEQALESPDYVSEDAAGEQIVRVGTEPDGEGLKIGRPTSLFGDLTTIERQTIVDITSSFGTSVLRDEIFADGSGVVSEDPDANTGEIELSTGTTPDSKITLRSEEYGRYTPGFSAQAGIGIRFESLPTEGEAKWGYFDDSNGFYFGYDGDQQELFVGRRNAGVEDERVYFSDFNGTGYEETYSKPFDLTDGLIFQIEFSWYGYGIVNFGVVSQTNDTIKDITPFQKTVNLHSIVVDGDTSTTDPNQPITVEIDNDTGDDNRIRVGGRQFSIFGSRPQDERTTSETKPSTSIANGTWTHIMSWRRQEGGQANARIFFQNFDLGINETSKFALVVNADVTGTTFNTPSLTPADETLLEVSTAGTYNGIGDGTKAWEGSARVAGTGLAQAEIKPEVNLSIGQANTVSLIIQGIAGTGDAISTMRFKEDY